MSNPKKHTIMKAKKIIMTFLLMMGMVTTKAATGYPAELILVSQPVMTYNANSITLYYDVQNIGDVRYKGYVYIFLDPDNGSYYAKRRVRVCPGRIKRIAIDIPAYRPNPSRTYTVMPYYSVGRELYSFTSFEYFDPLTFYWYGPRTETYYVRMLPPRLRHYHRPGEYRYFYDWYGPIMPPAPVAGMPMHPYYNPMFHTYSYHHSHGGYPAVYPHNYYSNWHIPGGHHVEPNNGGATPNNGNTNNSQATVRPHDSGTPGSMSTNGGNSGNANVNNGSNSGATTRPNNSGTSSGSNVNRSSGNSSNSGSGRTGTTDNNSNVSRPSSNSSNSGSGRTGTTNNSGSNVSRPSGNSSNSGSGRTGTTNNSGSNVSRPSGTSSNTGSGRTGTTDNSGSNVSRPSSNSSSSGTSSTGSRSGNSGRSNTSNSSSDSGRSGSTGRGGR